MTVRRSRAVLVAALLGAAAVSGCGNSGAPPQVLPPLPSASATATTGTTTAATPTDTAAALKRSAEQFLRVYLAEYDRAQRTNDLSRLERDFYAPGCAACKRDLAVLQEDKRKGRHVEGYNFEIEKIDPSDLQGNTISLDVVGHNTAGRVVESDGTLVEELRATKSAASAFFVTPLNDSWRIVHMISFGAVKP